MVKTNYSDGGGKEGAMMRNLTAKEHQPEHEQMLQILVISRPGTRRWRLGKLSV